MHVLPSHSNEYWTPAGESLPVLKAESLEPAGKIAWLNILTSYYLRPFSARLKSINLILKPLQNIVETPFHSVWKQNIINIIEKLIE